MISPENYKNCLEYIKKYWSKITFYVPESKAFYIGLPNKFVSPSKGLFAKDQFYWDSYFIILGLTASGKIKLAKGMVDNLMYLYKKYEIIPLRNRLYNLGISQPPFLTSMILEIYSLEKDKMWLTFAAKVAADELKNYWMAEHHLRFLGLSRYCDHFRIHTAAEHESGWDMTSRFNEKCLDYLPIDLNCCLYKYEKDLSEIYKILGNNRKSNLYLKKSQVRQKEIFQTMWNEEKGFFFDFDYKNQIQSNFYSMAGFYALWSGVATKEQADKVLKNVEKFEYGGGLANTQADNLSESFKQWDHPNGWANQQFIAIDGLVKYGFKEKAEQLAKKWLDLNKKVFEETGKFWEKYNVKDLTTGKEEPDRYEMQTGFGWTNAVFVRLIKEFSAPKEK